MDGEWRIEDEWRMENRASMKNGEEYEDYILNMKTPFTNVRITD